jgi:hypothetical protein
MYESLINSIESIFKSVPNVKEVYSYPLEGNPKQYPAIVFHPGRFDNSFETQAENSKIIRFQAWILINLAGTDEKTVWKSVMPKTIDAVVAKFDEMWSSTLDGHRVWKIIDTGDWGLSVEGKSKVAWAELTLTVKLLTDI